MTIKKDYLQYEFKDLPETVNTFDELPLWSAPFGLLLLKHLELRHDLTILDIGSGAGFPLLEIAARAGKSCKCIGIDSWLNANARARMKAGNYGLDVQIIDGDASSIPLKDNSIDLIVSNLGLNNFENREKVLDESYRVLKPGGKVAITTNLNGHWKEFYAQFHAALRELNMTEILPALAAHEQHRGSVETTSASFTDHGFKITRRIEESFTMNFLDGSSFLNHHFVKLGWLASWKALIPPARQAAFFDRLENNLNSYATNSQGLKLTVPMAFIEAVK